MLQRDVVIRYDRPAGRSYVVDIAQDACGVAAAEVTGTSFPVTSVTWLEHPDLSTGLH